MQDKKTLSSMDTVQRGHGPTWTRSNVDTVLLWDRAEVLQISDFRFVENFGGIW